MHAGELGGTSKLPRPPLQVPHRASVFCWERKDFALLICKLLNACLCSFWSAVVIAEAAQYVPGSVASGRVGYCDAEPVVSHLVCCTVVLGSGNLESS